MRRTALIAVAVLAVCGLAACGGSSGGSGGGGGGAVTLNWWAYNEPSGSFRTAAENCTKDSGGRYEIVFNPLGNDPDTQRQSLVRRLAAGDRSIDLMSLDVIWTAEFAQAGWIRPWSAQRAREISRGTLAGPLETARYEGRLFAAPANSNTQLLWYRKDLVREPPRTWDEMIDQAERLPRGGQVEVQGAAYEGTTVWFNSLVQSAGGSLLDGPTRPPRDRAALQRGADIIQRLSTSEVANPSLKNAKEDQARQAFEDGDAAFQVNYPFIYPSAADKDAAATEAAEQAGEEPPPSFQDRIGWAPYPAAAPGAPSKAPIGGFNWGVSQFTEHPEEAFDAATCLRDERNQRLFALDGGLPPTLSAIYDDASFQEQYPFGALVRRQLDDAGVRPASPVYADVSLAVYKTLSPGRDIDRATVVDRLTERISNALQSKGIL